MEKGVWFLDYVMENGLRTCGPVYVALAFSLMLTVAYTFFFIFLVEVRNSGFRIGREMT